MQMAAAAAASSEPAAASTTGVVVNSAVIVSYGWRGVGAMELRDIGRRADVFTAHCKPSPRMVISTNDLIGTCTDKKLPPLAINMYVKENLAFVDGIYRATSITGKRHPGCKRMARTGMYFLTLEQCRVFLSRATARAAAKTAEKTTAHGGVKRKPPSWKCDNEQRAPKRVYANAEMAMIEAAASASASPLPALQLPPSQPRPLVTTGDWVNVVFDQYIHLPGIRDRLSDAATCDAVVAELIHKLYQDLSDAQMRVQLLEKYLPSPPPPPPQAQPHHKLL